MWFVVAALLSSVLLATATPLQKAPPLPAATTTTTTVQEPGPPPPLPPKDDKDKEDNDWIHLGDFWAHNGTQTCRGSESQFPKGIRGVNLGGWMVLEPWITPSLFYQFLGKDSKTAAMDMYTFCQVLGPEEGNRQLKRHWDAWLTEDIVQELADSGIVNSFRLPVGDWMYRPYGPYVGCTDGALDYVTSLLDWSRVRGISVMLDIHGMKGSQNGLDNSGQSRAVHWTNWDTFEHWTVQAADWTGDFGRKPNYKYLNTNPAHLQHSLGVVQDIVERYRNESHILGLTPVNEPWQETPVDILKSFYWQAYLIVKRGAPHWTYVIHDSYRFETNIWGGFMKGCPDRALDTHWYQAWANPASRVYFYDDACYQKHRIEEMQRAFGPVIVGEWSLATDNCAMWLNGFNDNLPGFPKVPCKFIECGTSSYLSTNGGDGPTPLNPVKGPQRPYGTGVSTPMWGFCPTTRDWWKESKEMHETGTEWMRLSPTAPPGWDDTDTVMTALARKKLHAFGAGHGYYFWNFRTDVPHPHWSLLAALQRGWMDNKEDATNNVAMTETACDREFGGKIACVANRAALEIATRNAVVYALKTQGVLEKNATTSFVDDLHGNDLYQQADAVFDDFWKQNRAGGATCDFDGTAKLVDVEEEERQSSLVEESLYCAPPSGDDDNDNDKGTRSSNSSSPLWKSNNQKLLVGMLLGLLVGCLMGFRVGRQSKTNKKKTRGMSSSSSSSCCTPLLARLLLQRRGPPHGQDDNYDDDDDDDDEYPLDGEETPLVLPGGGGYNGGPK